MAQAPGDVDIRADIERRRERLGRDVQELMQARDPRALVREQVAQRRRAVAVIGVASFAFFTATGAVALLAGRAAVRRVRARF